MQIDREFAKLMQKIPNPGLIKHLIEVYFWDDNPPDSRYASSHWQYFGELFDVTMDDTGELTRLRGEGFGVPKWHGYGHRLIDSMCSLSIWALLPNKREVLRLRSVAKQICRRMGLDLTSDLIRQLFNLALIKRNLANADIHHQELTFLMIGDGYGVLSALTKAVFPLSTIVLVDLGKTLLFQAYYCQLAHPTLSHRLVEPDATLEHADFVYCSAEQLDYLEHSEFDIAVNVASMQEMDNGTVGRYFEFLRSHLKSNNLFYCLNRDTKTLIGGEISEFSQYPWAEGDNHLVDGDCDWYRYYFSRGAPGVGLFTFGRRIPLVNLFDGTHHHRLSVLETND